MIIDKIDQVSKRIDSFEDRMNDRFILLEAKFITRLDKEIGTLAEAAAKGFDEVKNDMKIGFASVDYKIASLQEFYASKVGFRLA